MTPEKIKNAALNPTLAYALGSVRVSCIRIVRAGLSVCLCWLSTPLSHGCLGPWGALISQTNGSCAAASLAALIYLPDMCFLVCFLSPARRAPMILSCVDGAPPFMPDESITPACSVALFSADRLFSTSINAGALGKGG